MESDNTSTSDTKQETVADTVIGGFTVIGDKLQRNHSTPLEILPYWITQATLFSDSVDIRFDINDIKELHELIRLRLISMGYDKLFPVQMCAIPIILKSYHISKRRPLCRPRDVCISAPTGSGKTLAYAAPIVQLLLNRTYVTIRVLVVVPVGDLATQVYNVFLDLTKDTDLKVALLNGSKSFVKEQADLIDCSSGVQKSAVDIAVVTPGRLVDHLYNTPGFSMERLRILVIDEADRVILEEKQDWYRLLEDALYYPNAFHFDPDTHDDNFHFALVGRPRPMLSIMHQYDCSHDITLQKILVSATLTHDPGPLKRFNLYFPHLLTCTPPTNKLNEPAPHMEVASSSCVAPTTNSEPISTPGALSSSCEKDLEHGVVSGASRGIGIFITPTTLKEYVVSLPSINRPLFLLHLIHHKNVKRLLCFVNTRAVAERLSMLLEEFPGLSVCHLSAGLPPDKRQRILKRFCQGDINILVCTDSMSRGMDIADVECVVSYDVPENAKTYVHRIGRTARGGRPGAAYTLLEKRQVGLIQCFC
ncbi:unnamed protein product [Dicrocoelium dendriticum]|nr:unnamed protein product [Dicrocoelium dendriticum]